VHRHPAQIFAQGFRLVGRLHRAEPELSRALLQNAFTDEVAEDLLRMLGVPAEEARDICHRPLPDPAQVPRDDSAA
jgi:hypothetical protein